MVLRGRTVILSKVVTSSFALAMAGLAAFPLLLLDTRPAASQQEPQLVIVNTLPPPRPAGLQIVTRVENPTIPAGSVPANTASTVASAQPAAAQVSAATQQTSPAPTVASGIAPPPATLAPPAPTAAPAPMQIAAAQATAIPVANTALSDAEVIARANDYFNTITMMSGRFVQA